MSSMELESKNFCWHVLLHQARLIVSSEIDLPVCPLPYKDRHRCYFLTQRGSVVGSVCSRRVGGEGAVLSLKARMKKVGIGKAGIEKELYFSRIFTSSYLFLPSRRVSFFRLCIPLSKGLKDFNRFHIFTRASIQHFSSAHELTNQQ